MLGALPSRHDLDKVVNDRPVFLMRTCWHIGVANTLALTQSGIDVDVGVGKMEGGEADVDAEGRLTGVLREDARQLIKRKPASKAFQKQCVLDGLNQCVRSGLTSVQTNDWGGEVSVLDLYRELESEGTLPVRVHLTPVGTAVAELPAPIKPTDGNGIARMLSCDRVKLFSDGSLGAGTAALVGGYADEEEKSGSSNGESESDANKGTKAKGEGVLMHSSHDLTNLVKAARAKDYRVETHAIGDLAARVTLDAYGAAGVCPSERPLLTHAQVLNDDLIDRMAQMGVIADVQVCMSCMYVYHL
jgi:predicted amidohydrolase YtcJ